MKITLTKRFSLLISILVMACALLVPDQGFGQGRGRGRGLDKKAAKFINGHDARDGRWDGRGPRARFIRRRRQGQIFFGDRVWISRDHKGKKVRGIYNHRRY